jgi:radical SAM protein
MWMQLERATHHASNVFGEAPQRVYWEVTRACELACRHCRAEAAPLPAHGELSAREGAALVERLATFTPKPHVIFTGGDPLMRPDLDALIAQARGLGLDVSVSPSATPRLTPEVIRKWRAQGVSAISLSIDGATAERHDGIRRVPGCFARTMDAGRTARAVGLPFQVNTLVAEETYDDLRAIGDLATSLGAARWSLFFLVQVGRGTVLNPVSVEQTSALFDWLAAKPRGSGPIITTTEAPHFRRVLLQRRHLASVDAAGHAVRPSTIGAGIRDGNGVMFIAHDGDVFPSGFLPVAAGNVRESDPVTIYRRSPTFTRLRDAREFGGRCGFCNFHGVCGGSRARAYAASGDTMAEDPLCDYQPPRSI